MKVDIFSLQVSFHFVFAICGNFSPYFSIALVLCSLWSWRYLRSSELCIWN